MKLKQIKMSASEIYDEMPEDSVPQWLVKEFNKVSKRRGDIRAKGKGKKYIIRVTDKKPAYYVYDAREFKSVSAKKSKPRPRDLLQH